jgi:hypothetical protein
MNEHRSAVSHVLILFMYTHLVTEQILVHIQTAINAIPRTFHSSLLVYESSPPPTSRFQAKHFVHSLGSNVCEHKHASFG